MQAILNTAEAVIMAYPTERRIDLGWGSARYVKATEYRATIRHSGATKSFWTRREAVAFVTLTLTADANMRELSGTR